MLIHPLSQIFIGQFSPFQFRCEHRAAIIEPKAFGALLRTIDGYDGQPETRIALQLLALTFVRPGELRYAASVERT